ncbi:MAG: hypothetical protein U0414_26640 [Polyangiaceae bacterium]
MKALLAVPPLALVSVCWVACAAPAPTTPEGNATATATVAATQTAATQGTTSAASTSGGGTTTGGASATTGSGDAAVPPPNCGKENETIETFPGHPNTRSCCPGLGPVFTMGILGPDGKCLPPPPVASAPAVCTKHCGDGKCSGDENKCNCSDCK